MMFDSVKKERRWNVTFFDYSSGNMDGETLKNYGMLNYGIPKYLKFMTYPIYLP